MFNRFPFYPQLESMDCGPACLKMVMKFYGSDISLNYLRKKCNITKFGITMEDLSIASNEIGFNSIPAQVDFNFLKNKQPFPCIVHWKNEHYLVLYKIKRDKIYVMDPSFGKIKYTREQFVKKWQESSEEKNKGYVLLIEPPESPVLISKENRTPSFWGIFKYFKGLKKYLIRLVICVLITALIQLIFPILMQELIDNGVSNKNLSFVVLILIAQLVLYASEMLLSLITSWITLYLNSKISINYISDYLTKLLKLPLTFYDSKNAGDILQRVEDFKKIHNFFSSTIVSMILSTLTFLMFGYLLFKYNINIFLTFVIGSIIYLFWTITFLKKRSLIDYERFGHEATNQDILIQIVNGIEEIKLNCSEKRRRWEWEKNQVQIIENSEKGLKLSQFQNTGGIFINQIKNLTITLLASQQVIESNLSLGAFISIQYIIGQLNVPIKEFVSIIQSAQDAKNSSDRLSEVNTWNEENYSQKFKSENINKSIQIKDLSFSYGLSSNKTKVLDSLNFEIKEGKTTAIVGDSGSGKTTFLKLLAKLYSPSSGEITIGRAPLNSFNPHQWRSLCGVVMQDGYIFNDSILKNITESNLNDKIDEKQLELAIKVSNLKEFIDSKPFGIATKIGSTGINLSGGQKQRILIARALYKNPEYIFLDEATSALDTINERIFTTNLSSFYKNKTIVVVAHRLSTVKNADSIIVLKDGSIAEIGNHDSLIKSKGYYHELIKNQLLD